MKISIIIPVYQSYRVVRRQISHFNRMSLPKNIEVIFMDDGSDPPLKEKFPESGVVQIYPTGDTRPWSNACAKNLGARIAFGEYLFMTDIDHIIPVNIIKEVYEFKGDKMEFEREYAILNNNARIIQSVEALKKYGFPENRYKRRGFHKYKHTNTFAMKRKIFFEIGCYPIEDCDTGRQDHRDDTHLHNAYRRHVKARQCKPAVMGGITYVFPNHTNSKLFHDLDRSID